MYMGKDDFVIGLKVINPFYNRLKRTGLNVNINVYIKKTVTQSDNIVFFADC